MSLVEQIRDAVISEMHQKSFNPVEKAALTAAQSAMLEPFACATQVLTDKTGKITAPTLDFWAIAQIVVVLYNSDGTARTPAEVYAFIEANHPTWRNRDAKA